MRRKTISIDEDIFLKLKQVKDFYGDEWGLRLSWSSFLAVVMGGCFDRSGVMKKTKQKGGVKNDVI